jgi:hypothetical protein
MHRDFLAHSHFVAGVIHWHNSAAGGVGVETLVLWGLPGFRNAEWALTLHDGRLRALTVRRRIFTLFWLMRCARLIFGGPFCFVRFLLECLLGGRPSVGVLRIQVRGLTQLGDRPFLVAILIECIS